MRPNFDPLTDQQSGPGWSRIDIKEPGVLRSHQLGEEISELLSIAAFKQMGGRSQERAEFIEPCTEAIQEFPIFGGLLRPRQNFDELVAVFREKTREIIREHQAVSSLGWDWEITGDGHTTVKRLVVHPLPG